MQTEGPDNVFSPVFGQNPEFADVLYVCMGPSFHANDPVELFAIFDVSSNPQQAIQLTSGEYNNAFPSTDPEGNLLFISSSTRPQNPNTMQKNENKDPNL